MTWPKFVSHLYKTLIFFTIYEILFENFILILPITYQNNTKMPGKNRMYLVI